MPKSLALIALISLALGLVGLHPCPPAAAAPPPSPGGCHEAPLPASSDTGECDAACKKACQPSMVLTSPLPAAGVLAPAVEAPRTLAARTLPLVSSTIDHIPLT